MSDIINTKMLIYAVGALIGGRYFEKNNIPLGKTHSDGSAAGYTNFLIGYFGTAAAVYGIGLMVGLEGF